MFCVAMPGNSCSTKEMLSACVWYSLFKNWVSEVSLASIISTAAELGTTCSLVFFYFRLQAMRWKNGIERCS